MAGMAPTGMGTSQDTQPTHLFTVLLANFCPLAVQPTVS
jgi:hypothetical protein